jgi:hypothetical protein
VLGACWRGILDNFRDLFQKEVKEKKTIRIWTRVHDKVDAREHEKRVCIRAERRRKKNNYKLLGLGTFCPLL